MHKIFVYIAAVILVAGLLLAGCGIRYVKPDHGQIVNRSSIPPEHMEVKRHIHFGRWAGVPFYGKTYQLAASLDQHETLSTDGRFSFDSHLLHVWPFWDLEYVEWKYLSIGIPPSMLADFGGDAKRGWMLPDTSSPKKFVIEEWEIMVIVQPDFAAFADIMEADTDLKKPFTLFYQAFKYPEFTPRNNSYGATSDWWDRRTELGEWKGIGSYRHDSAGNTSGDDRSSLYDTISGKVLVGSPERILDPDDTLEISFKLRTEGVPSHRGLKLPLVYVRTREEDKCRIVCHLDAKQADYLFTTKQKREKYGRLLATVEKAIDQGDADALSGAFAEGFDPNQCDFQQIPHLYRAMMERNDACVRAFLKAGATLDSMKVFAAPSFMHSYEREIETYLQRLKSKAP